MEKHAKVHIAPIRSRLVKNNIFYGIVILLTLVTASPIVLIISKLIQKGIRQINLSFFLERTPDTFEAMAAVANNEIIPGGIVNGITGSFLMIALASVVAIPIGILVGIYLYEHQTQRYASIVRDVTDILQGVPSIVLGLIAYMWVVKHITHGFSALAGSTALTIMMLPLIIRSSEETFKMIPEPVKEAALALGVPYHKVILRVIIPTGFSGLSTGILLSISRIIGETAPLMLTALGSQMVNFDISKPTSAVPLLIWEFYNDPNMANRIWSSSLFLRAVILTLNLTAKYIAGRSKN